MSSKKQDKLKLPDASARKATSASGASLKMACNATAISDSEIGTERRHLVAQKNQSNLFLIKSHSFIDRASAQRSVAKHRPSELIDRVNVGALLLAQNERDNLKSKSKSKKSKSKKSKAANNAHPVPEVPAPELHDVQHLLRRKPSVILEQEVSASTTSRRKSVPSAAAGIKRESFIRQSLQSIRRSFRTHKKYASSSATSTSSTSSSNCGEMRLDADANAALDVDSGSLAVIENQITPPDIELTNGNHVKFNITEETNMSEKLPTTSSAFNVCTFADTHSNSSMAPLLVAGSGHTETQSASSLDTIDKNSSPTQNQQQQHKQHKRQYSQQTSLSGSGTGSSEYSSANSSDSKSNKHSLTSLNPLVAANSLASIRSISPTRKSFNSNSSTTAKNEQSSSSAAAATAAATPTEKEKKRKEVSSSRVKKFQRHFSQVSKDEKLINYFSCALVSDILLQGHLYITDQHFAFYSNVFGYVTKVVIPTSSVTKISKEKTAKIIPNAVGVATADERHVFGSFISREAAFRLMCSVCPPLAPIELLSKMPVDILEYSEELSIEDDSSCSISGNESPPQASGVDGQSLLRRNIAGSSLNIGINEKKEKLLRHSDIPNNAKSSSSTSLAHHQGVSVRASAPPIPHYSNTNNNTNISIGSASSHSTNNNNKTNNTNNSITMSSLTSLLTTPTTGAAASSASNLTMIIAGTASSTSASSTPSPSSVSSTTSLPTTVLNTPPKPKTAAQAAATSFKALSKNALLRLKFPKELHVVYLGVLLSIVLALFTGFLLYRISNIEAKISLYRSPVVNYGSVNDDDIFADALRWQKELQTKSTEEAQNILNTNLQQIAKVRRSLETLSMLIHDRSSAATTAPNAAEAFERDDSD